MEIESHTQSQPDFIPGTQTGRSAVPREYDFSFTGSGKEYFWIWLSNVCLTVITLGLYGPWAKVRRLKYFYSHTFLDGSSFDYTANPKSILKGRLLALFVLLAVGGIANIMPLMEIGFYILGAIALPWILNQSLKFKSRYSSYRNISLGFSGTYGASFYRIIVLKIVGVLTVMALYPWAKFKEREYLLDNLRFGVTRFNIGTSKIGEFYFTYLFGGSLIFISVGIFIIRAMGSLFFEDHSGIGALLGEFGAMLMVLTGILGLLFGKVILNICLAKATWDQASLGALIIHYKVPVLNYFWIEASNLLLRIITLNLASPFCSVRVYKFKLEYLSLAGSCTLDEFMRDENERIRAYGDELGDALDLDIDIGF
jgi:uncharacterized membrane protein YjgN (DUF898 family)